MPGRSRAPRRPDAAVEYSQNWLAAEFVAEIRGAGLNRTDGSTHRMSADAYSKGERCDDLDEIDRYRALLVDARCAYLS